MAFSYKDLVELSHGTHGIPPKTTSVPLGWWGESCLDNLIGLKTLPTTWKNPATQKSMVHSFWYFVFSGTTSGSKPVHEIVAPMIFIARKKTDIADGIGYEYIFPDAFWGDTHPIYPNASSTTHLSSIIPELKGEGLEGVDFELPKTAVSRPEILGQYIDTSFRESRNVKVLKEQIMTILHRWGNAEAISREVFELINFSSFIATTLFRGICKDEAQLARGFNKKQFMANVYSLTGWSTGNAYAPPCKLCISKACVGLEKSQPYSPIILAMILKLWKLLNDPHHSDKRHLAMINAALLTHVAFNGLRTVVAMYATCEILGLTWYALADWTFISSTAATWQELAKFQNKYNRLDGPVSTHPWSRLINDGYFSDFAARNHPILNAVFAGVINVAQTGGDVKEAAWYKARSQIVEPYFNRGKVLYSLLSQATDEPHTENAQLLIEHTKDEDVNLSLQIILQKFHQHFKTRWKHRKK
ncbi:hypothetical protein KPH14_001208 [Odynerus spinipes]|uniref:Uncharacterized protein n=1 Tax=Odynerus spinipes TaxID=1348599 RepID=A0AAD9RQF3_9HYME|nr:hypothetical protein KPH14_001208 [Odynerus spinipes]